MSPDRILASARAIANDWSGIATLWHVALALLLIAMAMGWRPSRRAAGLLIAWPILSVGSLAWLSGNPFNGAVFVLLAAALAALTMRMERTVVRFETPAYFMLGAGLVAFGAVYPHFLAAESWVHFVYASPFGLLPCPTLIVAIGLTLMLDLSRDAAWSLVLCAAGLLYGVIGVFALGVSLDNALLAGALMLGFKAVLPAPAGRRVFLLCGAASSVLYVAMTALIGRLWEGYDWRSQAVSELSAAGAPTREIWAVAGLFYTALAIAFALAVRDSPAPRRRALRISGGLLLAYGLLGFLWPLAPMHSRETLAAGGGTASDTLHLVLAAVTVLLMFGAIAFGAAAFGRSFRAFSAAVAIVLLLFGALTFRDAPGLSANLPTPWLGVWERVNIGAFMLWIAVLSLVLLRRNRDHRVARGLKTLAA